jgi:hypothetical protein
LSMLSFSMRSILAVPTDEEDEVTEWVMTEIGL